MRDLNTGGGVRGGVRGVAVDEVVEVGVEQSKAAAGTGCAGAIEDDGHEALLMLLEDWW